MRVYSVPHYGDIVKIMVEPHPVTGRPRHVGYAGPSGWSLIAPSGGVRGLTPREKRIVEKAVVSWNLGFAHGLSDSGTDSRG